MPTATTDPTTGTSTSSAGGEDHARPTLLAGWHAHRRADLAAHVAHHGAPPLPRRGDASWAERFAGVVDASGLTGRGGAAFPSATKLGNVRSARGRPTLVVNAMEGEPASAKDKVLLSCVPHLVLDGAELAACALDAGRIVVCVPDAHDDTAAAVRQAVVERAGTGHAPVPVEVVRPPERYVAGEESALVSWLNGGPGAPAWRPDKRRPLTIGRGAALVHNAETLAHMALVARYGPASFRAAGSPEAPGTSLVTVSGGVEHPGVYEIAMGTALGAIVSRARPTDDVKAVLTGGFGGSWVPATALAHRLYPSRHGGRGGGRRCGRARGPDTRHVRDRRDRPRGALHGGRERRTVRALCLRAPCGGRRSRAPGLRHRRPLPVGATRDAGCGGGRSGGVPSPRRRRPHGAQRPGGLRGRRRRARGARAVRVGRNRLRSPLDHLHEPERAKTGRGGRA